MEFSEFDFLHKNACVKLSLMFCYSCRADGLPYYIGLILPVVLLFIFNWIMYIIIIVSVCHQLHGAAKVTNSKVSVRKLAWTTAVLSVVFGLGWGFGLAQTSVPDYSSEAAQITVFILQVLFAVLVGSQGVLIFIFYGIGNKKVRDVWKKPFASCKQKKVSVDYFIGSSATSSNRYIATTAAMKKSTPVVLMSYTTEHDFGTDQPSTFIETTITVEDTHSPRQQLQDSDDKSNNTKHQENQPNDDGKLKVTMTSPTSHDDSSSCSSFCPEKV